MKRGGALESEIIWNRIPNPLFTGCMTEAKEFLQVLFQHLQNGNADGADSDEDYDCDRPVRTA